jgi:hypothetical protein
MSVSTPLYGLVAEFATPEAIARAVRAAYDAGYRRMDAFTPYPMEELAGALHYHKTHVPAVMFIGGLVGGIGGYLMQYYLMAVDYPINVGGRPLHSWPAFIPVTFEMTILISALSGVLGLLGLCGLPMPYHPLFNVPGFVRASQDRFFLCIEAKDARFDGAETRRFLESLQPCAVEEVPP